ncbi:type II toxin -antitoxin system TacA 1-like antitoxin [Pseudotabrizicola sp. L79]|uniref:type II toxin -antitoxin system TacA 1-like antitoxin n=1 Tax=Pseudotabrizicola sp. L79 TaxID=3118402 RepID=UPI002F9317E7
MGRRTTRLRLSADALQRKRPWRSEEMKPANDNSADVTSLKPCDHQAFFEVLDSPPSPTEALRAAFRRRREFLADIGATALKVG